MCFVESGFGKARPRSLGNGLVRISLGTHSKVDLSCLSKPYTDVM